MTTDTNHYMFVLSVPNGHAEEFDVLKRLFTLGAEAAIDGVEYFDVLELDDTEVELLTGLQAAHGHMPVEEHEASFAAWNSARLLMGAHPHARPEGEWLNHTVYRWWDDYPEGPEVAEKAS